MICIVTNEKKTPRGPWATSLGWETVPLDKHIRVKRRMLCAKFGWNWPTKKRFWRRRFLNSVNMYFRYFVIISLWTRAWSFIWKKNPKQYFRSMIAIGLWDLNKLKSPSSKDALKINCAKYSRNWPSDFANVFLQFRYYLPLEKAWHFIWIHLNPLNPRIICAKIG